MNATPPPNPQAYVTKDESLIRELLHPNDIPGLGMSLAEAVVEAGARTAAHRHPGFDEIYYGLEGEGTLHIDGQPHAFSPHRYYLLPRGALHWLQADTHLRLLCICCPGYTHEGTMLE
ncbi:MAG: cupin domain-containing protein [Candidatus Accumulibacter sp.]|jgi:quercetin dioxygenase-like cupin family protein|nr:cupin domain-containing protein [Accumulibacter sp.]